MKRSTVAASFIFLCIISQCLSAQTNQEIIDKLSVVTFLAVNNSQADLPQDSILRKHLKIELILDGDYAGKKATSTNHLLVDTAKIKKKRGLLRLPLTQGYKTFSDKLTDDDGREEYEYMGQFAFLNAYLVYCQYWEAWEYKLITKKDGTEIETFSAKPFVSNDKKKIATVDADPYETDSGIEIFSIVNGRTKNILQVRFKNWMPAVEDGIFWGNDGKLYIPVQWAEKFWNTDGSYNTDYLYIRVTLL